MFYAIENPYGITTLNTDGSRPNRLRLFTIKNYRDRWVWDDAPNRQRVDAKTAKRIIAQAVKAGGPADSMEYTYMERG